MSESNKIYTATFCISHRKLNQLMRRMDLSYPGKWFAIPWEVKTKTKINKTYILKMFKHFNNSEEWYLPAIIFEGKIFTDKVDPYGSKITSVSFGDGGLLIGELNV